MAFSPSMRGIYAKATMGSSPKKRLCNKFNTDLVVVVCCDVRDIVKRDVIFIVVL